MQGRPALFRRMLIIASEDVGLAVNAVVVINACVEAFDRVGMPGRYHLAQALL